ncbi:hypothetical protein Tco_1234361 [Tanacetum coccineum]
MCNLAHTIILRKEDEVREEENVKPNATKYNDHEMIAKAEENVEEESKDEFEEEIEEEEEEEEEDVRTKNETVEPYEDLQFYTTSIIDHDLGAVVFGKPFGENTRLIYDKKEGTVAFKDNNEKLIFKMPHKMEMFKNVNFTGVNTDMIPPFIIEGNGDDNEKTYYSANLNLGPEYKYDESVCKAIRSLIRIKNIRKSKGEVT